MYTHSAVPAGFFHSLLSSTAMSVDFLRRCAFEVGFVIRQPRKISAEALVAALCEQSIHGSASYNDVAAALDAQGAPHPSRQAVANRMNAAFLLLCQKLLSKAIAHKVTCGSSIRQSGFLSSFKRVLIQDSTILKLPMWLFESFSGVSNAHCAVCNARIQVVYDLVSMSFVEFSIDSYSRNDLAAASSLQLQCGDLVLRDRGYLTAEEIARHIAAQAHCIYRHKTGTSYLDPATQNPIDLLALLQSAGALDRTVLLNDKQRTCVRLVAAPVTPETAALRRMKAKKETRGHNPSQEVLALMDWTIFITTIPASQADFRLLLALYGLRWRIEIVFKSWKSHLHFDTIHRVSKTQLLILLAARLLVICALTNTLYKLCHQLLWQRTRSPLSLLKFLNYISKNPNLIAPLVDSIQSKRVHDPIWISLKKYCCHEKRRRANFWEDYNRLLLS